MTTHPLLHRGRLFIRTHSGLFSSLRPLERRWLASPGISAPLRRGVARSDSESAKLSQEPLRALPVDCRRGDVVQEACAGRQSASTHSLLAAQGENVPLRHDGYQLELHCEVCTKMWGDGRYQSAYFSVRVPMPVPCGHFTRYVLDASPSRTCSEAAGCIPGGGARYHRIQSSVFPRSHLGCAWLDPGPDWDDRLRWARRTTATLINHRNCSWHGFFNGRCLGFLLAFLLSLPGFGCKWQVGCKEERAMVWQTVRPPFAQAHGKDLGPCLHTLSNAFNHWLRPLASWRVQGLEASWSLVTNDSRKARLDEFCDRAHWSAWRCLGGHGDQFFHPLWSNLTVGSMARRRLWRAPRVGQAHRGGERGLSWTWRASQHEECVTSTPSSRHWMSTPHSADKEVHVPCAESWSRSRPAQAAE